MNNRDTQKWLKELNPQQLKAVTHSDGPTLVIAGAGSGKTKTLAFRVAYLISQGVPPDKILLLTFTRRAAKEMLRRAGAAISSQGSIINQVWGGTFHAIANRLLRLYAQPAGLSPDFTIIDQSDAEDLLQILRHKLGCAAKDKRFPKKSTCLSIYSRRMNSQKPLETVIKKHFPWCEKWIPELKPLFKEYVTYKQKQAILDYDDLLLYWYYLLDNPQVAESVEKRFDHILVDEYQDTNTIQADILSKMRRKKKNIMVVGDDAQSIYSFRYATVRNILDFPKTFPTTEVITLEQNYRSTEMILQSTNRIIAQASERYSKNLFTTRKGGARPQLITCKDETHENEIVTSKILEQYEAGIPLHKQAVLFRASSHSNSLELALMHKEIPFHKHGGLRFLEAAHIKDLVGILRILENHRDEMAWFRVLQLLDGVGPATAAGIFKQVNENPFNPKTLKSIEAPSAIRGDVSRLTTMLCDILTQISMKLSVQIERIITFYKPLLEKNYENSEPRSNDIEHLAHLAKEYTSRRQFLNDLILDPPSSTSDFAGPAKKSDDHLILSTIHSAKGGEWDVVYLIHAADGCLPSDMATGNDAEIEEELRLAYVAMTRAKDFLYITWPLRFYKHHKSLSDHHTYAQRSRFFTDEVCTTFEEIALPESEENTDHIENIQTTDNIGAKLQDLWD